MWLNRKRFDDLVKAELEQRLRREAAERDVALLRQHVDWLTTSVNRLELERATLIQHASGVNLPVPQVIATRPRAGGPVPGIVGSPLTDEASELGPLSIGSLQLGDAAFEDMGDDEAARQGLGAGTPIVRLA